MNTIQFLSSQPWVARLGETLLHFLWQGALIASLYALARRQAATARPQVRYLLGCIALALMLTVPIVTFNLLGASDLPVDQAFTAPVPLNSTPTSAAPASLSTLTALATPVWRDSLMPWLVIIWFAGAIIFWARLAGGWVVASRMRSTLVRPAPASWQRTLNEISFRVRVSRPTVVGWLRPVILVPVGALAGLPPEHIEALLAHELAHIRRHDYLVNILQTMAEALLFYHPAIWWISNHVRNERELCCDDVAVAANGDAFIYARALANLESHRPAHLRLALAANGGDLPARIARLLGVRYSGAPRASGPALIAVGILIVITAAATFAHPAAPKPSFEVASIKPSPPEYVGFQSYVKGERYTAMTATVRNLVEFAYGLRDFQISGGPPWSGSTAYNISATMDAPATAPRARLMLQALLADRFGLKFHRITKKRPGYALVIDKNGPKLTESKNPGPGLGLGRGNLNGRGADMRLLAGELSSQLESPLADRTRLTALYDFTLTWTPDVEAGDSSGPSIFTAIREQLGLRLDAVKNVPVDILVIDNAEKPSEN